MSKSWVCSREGGKAWKDCRGVRLSSWAVLNLRRVRAELNFSCECVYAGNTQSIARTTTSARGSQQGR